MVIDMRIGNKKYTLSKFSYLIIGITSTVIIALLIYLIFFRVPKSDKVVSYLKCNSHYTESVVDSDVTKNIVIGLNYRDKMIDFMSNLQLSGVFLIIIFFIIVVIMSILIPSTSAKWILSSPVVVPLFMRSNITPDFTQFVFQVADSVGKGLTPVFAYFIVMIGFMHKYSTEDDRSYNIVDTLKVTLPITLIMGLVWIAIVVLWYISGLPIGINGFSTL